MVEAAALHEPVVLVVPGNVLPAHVQVVFQHEGKLGFQLVRQKLVIVVKEREVLA